MKHNQSFWKSILIVPGIVLLAFNSVLLGGCTKKESSNTQSGTYTTTGNSSGAQQNPPNSSSGSGTLNGTFNAATNIWQYTITWSNLTAAASSVEVRGPASVGVNGSLMFTLNITTPGINGSATGTVVLSAQQEADLLANRCYYTIPSSAYAAGEIRGQIMAAAN